MTIQWVTDLLHKVISAQNQVILIVVSLAILGYTLYVSGFKKDWMRYLFLIAIGSACFMLTSRMTNLVNQDFFSGLSTELFGAAITLALIDSLDTPSMKWLVFFIPLVVGTELFMYIVPGGSIQNFVIGMVSNLWGALLVAILIGELIYERKKQRGGPSTLDKKSQRREFLQFERDILLLQHEKTQIDDMIKALETEIKILRNQLGIPESQPWDSKYFNLSESRREKFHKEKLAHISTLRETANERKSYRDLLIIRYRQREAENRLWRFEQEIEHLHHALSSPFSNDWDLHITFFGHSPDDVQARVERIRKLIYVGDRIEVVQHPNQYCHCTLKASTHKKPETSANSWQIEAENTLRADASV